MQVGLMIAGIARDVAATVRTGGLEKIQAIMDVTDDLE